MKRSELEYEIAHFQEQYMLLDVELDNERERTLAQLEWLRSSNAELHQRVEAAEHHAHDVERSMFVDRLVYYAEVVLARETQAIVKVPSHVLDKFMLALPPKRLHGERLASSQTIDAASGATAVIVSRMAVAGPQ